MSRKLVLPHASFSAAMPLSPNLDEHYMEASWGEEGITCYLHREHVLSKVVDRQRPRRLSPTLPAFLWPFDLAILTKRETTDCLADPAVRHVAVPDLWAATCCLVAANRARGKYTATLTEDPKPLPQGKCRLIRRV